MNKNKRHIFIRLLSGLLILSLLIGVGMTDTTVGAAKKKAVSISKKSMTIGVTYQKQLTLKGLTKKQNKKVKWSTTDKSVATVKSGLVSTWKPGKATIRAKYGKKTYTCKLTVKLKSKGQFYLPNTEKNIVPVSWTYKEEWFTESAEIYQKDLAALSTLLCWASGPAPGKSEAEQSANVKMCLTALGFHNFDTNEDYKKTPTTESFGVAYAEKKVSAGGKTYHLIAIVPRSSGYGKEFAANVAPGVGPGDHEGFTAAKEKLLTGLNAYLTGHKITGDIKLWFSGHSRGATAPDLAEGALADHPELLPAGVSLQKQDIYGYNISSVRAVDVTNETDRTRLEKDYPFIHNVELPYDIATKVFPIEYGFDRYGVIHTIPCTEETEKKAMETLKKVDPACYADYTKSVETVHEAGNIGDALIRAILKETPTRKEFAETKQPELVQMASGDGDLYMTLLPMLLPYAGSLQDEGINLLSLIASPKSLFIQHYLQVIYSFLV